MPVMAIFQNSVVREYAKKLDAPTVDARFKIFQAYFLDPTRQAEIRKMKEEEFKPSFLRELFKECLGYTIRPDEGFNFTVEHKNVDDSKKADAAIVREGKTLGVVEVKGTDSTDLTKAAVQAFGYKNHQPDARYILVTNFEKLRFYVDNAVEFEEFTLFRLDRAGFERLFLCLSWESIRDGLPLRLKDASVSEEDQITKRLYADYSAFRAALFADIRAKNAQHEPLLLFKKTQKLIDRFLFILFAEDRGLLPANMTAKILTEWQALKKARIATTLYDRFKLYFNDLLEGNREQDIFAYNGGLFRPDAILDSLAISDDVLATHALKLSNYDFVSEVDVDILGHIFEHSLSEIEEVEASLTGAASSEKVSKRKKDGIFYTPKYITQYIVENTLGRLCAEKKKTLGLDVVEAVEEGNAKKARAWRDARLAVCDTYREWLLSLSVCDPACGSGAFLNAALDFLMAEHRAIDEEKARIHGDALIFPDIENSILERNLYGVDLNEESVEIAKLSLWLRTAQKGRKLSTLTGNIKCGNSLIPDPAIAGEKAFDWQKEFPAVFEKGGFDVVIGNPPYVRVQNLAYETTDYLKAHYEVALKRVDISLCFIELSRKITKNGASTCFITSNQFLTTEYGQAARRFLLSKYCLRKCIDFGDLPVFEEALTYVSIFLFINSSPANFSYASVSSLDQAQRLDSVASHEIEISSLSEDNWILKNSALSGVFEKMAKGNETLGTLGNAWAGLFTGLDSVLMFDASAVNGSDIERDLLLPVMRAENCSQYYCTKAQKFVVYPYALVDGKTVVIDEAELSLKYPKAYAYLVSHKAELEARKDSRKTFAGRPDWYSLVRFGQLSTFRKTKILSPGEVKGHKFCIDESGAGFSCARVFAITVGENINIKFLLCILNSTIARVFLQSFSSLKSGGYYSYSSNILNRMPVPVLSSVAQQPLVEAADKMMAMNSELSSKRENFLSRVRDNLAGAKMTGVLENFEELEFAGFLKELKKQKIKLALSAQAEWEVFFNDSKAAVVALSAKIAKMYQIIDQMVYALYGLTPDEIRIVDAGK